MHIGYVPRERPPFSALNFRSGAYHFHKFPKNPFRSITILQFFGGFCRSGDHHFQNFFNFNPFIASHGRLSPNAKRSAAPRVSQTRPGSSGDWHFHAQNGSSSFRSPAFSSSKRLKLVPEPLPIFTLPQHILTKIWGEYPPPPPRPLLSCDSPHFYAIQKMHFMLHCEVLQRCRSHRKNK